MGRYLRGTEGFSYKYAFASQDDNLRELSHASGAGRGALLPSFGGGYISIEKNFDIPVIPLLRAIKTEGKAVGGEIAGVLPPAGDTLLSSTLEFVQYALGENLIEVVLRLDRALEDIPLGVTLEGYATYNLDRAEYPTALAYINRFLAAPVELDELRSEQRVEAIWRELGDVEGYLPAMALSILQHAVRHDLPAISVHESDRSLYAPDFWELAAEWGPSIFYSATPGSPAEWFVRGFCELLRGDREGGTRSMATAAKAGFAPATRWTAALGGAKKQPAAKAKKKPAKKPAAKKQTATKKKPAKKKPAAKKTSTKKKPAKKKPAKKRR
jgi:hypothetical protein